MVVSDFHVFVRDVLQHVDAVQKDHPGLPVFLLGHSMVSSPAAPSVPPGWGWRGSPSAHAAHGAPGKFVLRKQVGVGVPEAARPTVPPRQGPGSPLLPLFGVGPLSSPSGKHSASCRFQDRKSTRLNSSHRIASRMPSSA